MYRFYGNFVSMCRGVRGCVEGVSRVYHDKRVCQGCIMIRGCVKGVLRVCQGYITVF